MAAYSPVDWAHFRLLVAYPDGTVDPQCGGWLASALGKLWR